MELFNHPDFDDHGQVVFAHDAASGLKSIIAIHDTNRGPSLGGCRIWPYKSQAEAVTDVLRLSRGMSYKAALAGLALGGGKSVVLADSRTQKTPAMMRAMGRAVDQLAGRYIVAEDVGATVQDMDQIASETAHVTGVSDGAGDPSPWTAQGVFLSLQAAVAHRFGKSLKGLRIAVTGLGNVGTNLCRQLHAAGAELVVADIQDEAVARIVQETGARPVAPEKAHAADVDVFAPCALGAVLNQRTIPELKATLVCGAANNQLETSVDGQRLHDRGILYAPDYLVNAGGLISVARTPLQMTEADGKAHLQKIPDTLLSIFATAVKQGLTPGAAADQIARQRFRPSPADAA